MSTKESEPKPEVIITNDYETELSTVELARIRSQFLSVLGGRKIQTYRPAKEIEDEKT